MPSRRLAGWKELYKAALSEKDRNKLSERIARAEWAVAVRAQELFHSTEHLQERQAIAAATHALKVLGRTQGTRGETNPRLKVS